MDAEIQLVVVEGPDAGARVTVRAKPALIGRGHEAELQLTDRKVSRQHVQARLERDAVVLQLLDGASPMRLGDERVTTATLAPGERVTIGATTLLAERTARAKRSAPISGRCSRARTKVAPAWRPSSS